MHSATNKLDSQLHTARSKLCELNNSSKPLVERWNFDVGNGSKRVESNGCQLNDGENRVLDVDRY